MKYTLTEYSNTLIWPELACNTKDTHELLYMYMQEQYGDSYQ